MKKLLLLPLFAVIALLSAFTHVPQEPTPDLSETVKFEKLVHDFGEVPTGSQARYEFVFTNTSNQPLEIKSVKASCGCTAPSYSKEPVAPGKTGSVVAVYTAPGRATSFTKFITVETSHGTFRLTIKGNVVEQEKEPETPIRVN